MRKISLLLIIVLCFGLLVGCGSKTKTTVTTTAAPTAAPTPDESAPEEPSAEDTEGETTTQEVVNIVEDPLSNGEGDPLDGIDGATDDTGIKIEIEEDGDAESGGNNGGTTTPNEGNAGGNTSGETTESEDDFVVDFDDLTGK